MKARSGARSTTSAPGSAWERGARVPVCGGNAGARVPAVRGNAGPAFRYVVGTRGPAFRQFVGTRGPRSGMWWERGGPRSGSSWERGARVREVCGSLAPAVDGKVDGPALSSPHKLPSAVTATALDARTRAQKSIVLPDRQFVATTAASAPGKILAPASLCGGGCVRQAKPSSLSTSAHPATTHQRTLTRTNTRAKSEAQAQARAQA